MPSGDNQTKQDFEFLYRAIMESSPFPVYVKDRDLRFIDVNAAFEKEFGVTKSDMKGKLAGEHLTEQEATPAREHDRLVAETREGFSQVENINGKLYKAPILDEGEFAGIVGYDLDIDDLKRTEAELLETQEQLHRQANDLNAARAQAEQASQAKTQFLAFMSHELRTPLNAILGFSEALQLNAVDTSNPERLTEYASIIHSSGKHLLSLLNDLLDISRIEAGKHALEESLFDIEAVLHAAVGLFSENAEAKRLEITFDDSVRPLIFRGDRR